MKNYILSLDDGGTYIKAGIYDFKGRQIRVVKHYNHVVSLKPGYTEYDPEELWQTNCRCIKEVLAETGINPNEIAAIGLSAQGSGCYFLGEEGTIVRNFISSGDHRAVQITKQWEKKGINEKAYPYVYRNSTPGNTNALLAWLKENEPENYCKIRWIFSMKDYLAYRLTGKIISGYGCMSASALMNLRTGEFDSRLAEIFGIPEVTTKLANVFGDLDIVGTVTEEAARICGCIPGIPVAAGLHDVVATAFAMGIVNEKYCFSIMGTCAINSYISPVPILNKTIHYNELFPIQGMYLIEEPGSASAGILEWVINLFFDRRLESAVEIYDRINKMVSAIVPQNSTLIFVPQLKWDGDHPKAKGGWVGIEEKHSMGEMLLAVLESIVFTHRIQLEQIFLNRVRPSKIRVGGGASNSGIWMQIFADTMAIPVEIMKDEEMGTKGAAIGAAIALGIYPSADSAIEQMTAAGELVNPRQEYIDVYEEKYQRFRKVTQAMEMVWQNF